MSANPLAPELGAQIKQTRRSRGLTNEALAAMAGISSNTLTRLEQGQGSTPRTLNAVLDALEISPLAEIDDFPPKVAVLQELVGLWLMTIAPEQRDHQVKRLMRFVINDPSVRRPDRPANAAAIQDTPGKA